MQSVKCMHTRNRVAITMHYHQRAPIIFKVFCDYINDTRHPFKRKATSETSKHKLNTISVFAGFFRSLCTFIIIEFQKPFNDEISVLYRDLPAEKKN